MAVKYDFSGYATKNDLKCADGRTIIKDAFKECDGKKVPLVWQHLHNEPTNVLGHAVLENREDGVYTYCSFNDTDKAKNTKTAVGHGDITALSIYANALKQKGSNVIHGVIREVSLVLAGANAEALIDNLYFAHGDGTELDESEAIIYSGLEFEIAKEDVVEHMTTAEGTAIIESEIADLTDDQKERLRNRLKYTIDEQQTDVVMSVINTVNTSQRAAIYKLLDDALKHEAPTVETLMHAKYAEDATIQDVFDTLDETQKTVVYALIAQAIGEGAAEHSDINNNEGEGIMKTNIFDKQNEKKETFHLTHDQFTSIVEDAKKIGSLKESWLAHATEWGIDPIEVLFPDAQLIRNTPDLIKRDDGWVAGFFSEVSKSRFSRIKSTAADLTADEARAKGYVTGKRKIEEVIKVLKRITTPTTVYKKQKIDRDDMIDITDFDVIAWMKREMRLLLDEELARAVMIGDGRSILSDDHIDTECIRPIWGDDELYTINVDVASGVSVLDLIDSFVLARIGYKGSGTPTLYTTEEIVTKMLLARDLNQRRVYPTIAELTSALRVTKIVTVEVMENATRTEGTEERQLIGIMVNLRDYTLGADRGGEVTMFDDFDIDYNQYKYLIETRVSGALTRPKSAITVEQIVAAG